MQPADDRHQQSPVDSAACSTAASRSAAPCAEVWERVTAECMESAAALVPRAERHITGTIANYSPYKCRRRCYHGRVNRCQLLRQPGSHTR